MVNNSTIKIAFSGKAGSGKNTAVNIFKKYIHKDYHKKKLWARVFSFADPIKEIARKYFPALPRKYFFGKSAYRSHIIPNTKDIYGNDLTVRKLLQDIGSQGRKYNENIWTDNIMSSVKKFDNYNGTYGKWVVIVSDVRFINEFNTLKENGFKLIRIKRDVEELDDLSEKEQDLIYDSQFDYIVDNNGSKQDLIDNLYKIYQNVI